MASIAELIDFLMSMMRDDDSRMKFERDPDAALADSGLEGVTGQDVRDARLMMADDGAVHARPSSGGRPERNNSDNDAIQEIRHTTTHFEVGDVTTTVITIDDRDTVVVDSFNNDVVAIQDNDTTDVDVISIVDNGDETEAGEEENGPEGELGEEPADGSGGGPDVGLPEGFGPGGEVPADPGSAAVTGFEVPDGSGEGTGSGQGEDLGGGSGFGSGAGEGFAPEEDSGFGTQPELGAEAGLTEAEPPAEEPIDELVG
jgi:hypothetical protein